MTHECNEVLDPTYNPGSEPEEQELFEANQTFMFSVFNANLQTDMGKTIVRRHLANTDAQSVWKELSEHMRTSSKGASEKRRLIWNHNCSKPLFSFLRARAGGMWNWCKICLLACAMSV